MNGQTILAKSSGITLAEHTQNLLDKFNDINLRLREELHLPTKLAILLHDIGKALPHFQIKKVRNRNYQPVDILIDIPHSIFSVFLINKKKLEEILLENNADNKYSHLILSAVAFHHWRDKYDDILRFGSKHFEKLNSESIEFKNQIIENLNHEFQAFQNFPVELIEFDQNMLTEISNGIGLTSYVTPPYQLYYFTQRIDLSDEIIKDWILIAGFLIRCDHFASYCEEEGTQEQIEIDLPNFLNVEQKIQSVIQRKISSNENLPIWQLDRFQNFVNKNTILIAPTGIGKTEFAFLWADSSKFFYTLPLRAAVEQTYERAKEIFNTNGLNDNANENQNSEKVGLLHFDADVYLITDDKEESAIRLYENARQLAYPVTISTGDQFFPYALRPPGYEKIYSIFSYSNLVVDEIQAYDPQAAAIIVKFIEDVNRMGGKTLIMTATFPTFIKDELSKRIKNLSSRNENLKPEIINIYDEERDKLSALKKHKIQLVNIDNSNSSKEDKFDLPDNLVEEIISKGENNRVLVIFNTINQAQRIFDELKDKVDITKTELYLLHSRFTFNDREKLQNEIQIEFSNPKPGDENKGKILIATQVVEAAIDIDADYLFTEIAPLDSLVQRMGRVLRRYRENYKHEGEPNVKIFIFSEGYESGNGKVYHKELIETTKTILINLKKDSTITIEKLREKIKSGGVTPTSKRKSKKKKSVEDFDIPEEPFLISEYQKYELVNLLYELLKQESEYLRQFYLTLELLDAGYMSDKKLEAQRKFRPMITTQVISTRLQQNLIEDLRNFVQNYLNGNRAYTMFKEKIISEYVVNIIGLKSRNKNKSLSFWIENEADLQLSDEQKQRLMRWTEDIYFVDFDYDDKRGLDRNVNSDLVSETRFL